MSIFVTSDHHWGHRKIITMCNRPFSNVEEMDEEMIKRWNEVVREEDIVYHLGDMFWNERAAKETLHRLNGIIHLLIGNHDKNWKRVCNSLKRSDQNSHSRFIVEENGIVELKFPIRAVLCHYPMMSWNGAFHKVWHFAGHTHNNNCLSEGRRVNVCVENTNYTPINLDTFINKITWDTPNENQESSNTYNW